jgi:hypothetical protein
VRPQRESEAGNKAGTNHSERQYIKIDIDDRLLILGSLSVGKWKFIGTNFLCRVASCRHLRWPLPQNGSDGLQNSSRIDAGTMFTRIEDTD